MRFGALMRKQDAMNTIRFTPIKLAVCVGSMLLLTPLSHVSADMITDGRSDSSAHANSARFDDAKPAKEAANAKLTAAEHSRHPSSGGSDHPAANRHHHHGVVAGDPPPQAPQVAQLPDAGTSVVLMAIALGILVAVRLFSGLRTLSP